MTMKWMAVLALGLLAPAAYSQKIASAPVPAAGQMKVLREEIKRDKADLTAKVKAGRAERAQLMAQQKAEAAKLKVSTGTRAEKTHARQALRVKYAGLMKDARVRNLFERRHLRDDITSKSGLIKRLRQS